MQNPSIYKKSTILVSKLRKKQWYMCSVANFSMKRSEGLLTSVLPLKPEFSSKTAIHLFWVFDRMSLYLSMALISQHNGKPTIQPSYTSIKCAHLIYLRNANCEIQLELETHRPRVRKKWEDTLREWFFCFGWWPSSVSKYSFNPIQIADLDTECIGNKLVRSWGQVNEAITEDHTASWLREKCESNHIPL